MHMSSKKNGTTKPWIIKFANVEDAATGNSYEEFKFGKPLGRQGKLRIERDKARDDKALLAAFARKNAVLPHEDDDALKLIEEAIKSDPPRHRLHVRRLGWLPRGEGFALKRRVLGAPNGVQSLRPPLWVNDRQVGVLKSSGTLEQWLQHVARPAMYSTRLMLVLAAAFAAPLVGISGLQNFGINIFGRSKVGKTTALLVGASAIGIGTERDLPNWNSTNNAFLETARGFNDLMLPANEVGLLAGKRRDAYAPIRERIYAFSEGRDRVRLSNSTMATTWASSSWQGIFVSTSEYSFNDYAAFSGETRGSGEFARCLDVAAVEKGCTTVFDSYPKDVETKRRKRWARTRLTELRENCARFHGTALEPFVTYLIAVSGQLPKKVGNHCSTFMKAVRAMHLDGALEHARRNFALIYAGGCVAIEAKILPWTEESLFQAIESCFRAAVEDIRGHTNSLGRARAILKTKLQSDEIVQARPGKAVTPERCAGYWQEEAGIRSYTIHAKAFCRWFPSRAQAVMVLRWLYDQGDLISEKGKLPPRCLVWAITTEVCRPMDVSRFG
jgi:putative DNA primase/helicase